MKNVLLLGVLGFSVVGLLGCGGGSGGGTESSSKGVISSQIKTSTSSSIFSSHSSSSLDAKDSAVLTGFFRDSAVSGLDYISCDAARTQCLSGVTDADGMYLYRAGYSVTFKIENLVVLNADAKNLITPLNSASSSESATKLAQFLMSIDEDGNPSNGIQISSKTKELAIKDFNDLLGMLTSGGAIVTPEVANEHLTLSARLDAYNKESNYYTDWVLGKKNIPPSANVERLSKSASARLKYALWLHHGNQLLVRSSSIVDDAVQRTLAAEKISGSIFDGIKIFTNFLNIVNATLTTTSTSCLIFEKGNCVFYINKFTKQAISAFEPEMVPIPGTTYSMSKYETTFDQYDAYTNETGAYKPDDSGWGRGTRPVINVSWDDAVAYAAWLSKKTGKNYRLPTEVEWVFSAKAGATTNYFWGDKVGVDNANCVGCGSQWDAVSTAPVGSFTANAFGLFDIHGNVYEWTSSCFDGVCSDRQILGGSWGDVWSDKKAAEQGFDEAQVNLGVMYANGVGVKRNLQESVVWFKKSAEQGNALGQYYLGYAYEHGHGIEKDQNEAIAWYKKAAAQGHADAENSLDKIIQLNAAAKKIGVYQPSH